MKIFKTDGVKEILLIRLLIALVFMGEGIQKFLFTESLGAGRFLKLGLPHPHVLASTVGSCEILFGMFVGLGVFTRLAVMPLLIVISVAIYTTKLPILWNHEFWGFIHESRTDLSMLVCLLFVLKAGSGPIALDRILKSMVKE